MDHLILANERRKMAHAQALSALRKELASSAKTGDTYEDSDEDLYIRALAYCLEYQAVHADAGDAISVRIVPGPDLVTERRHPVNSDDRGYFGPG